MFGRNRRKREKKKLKKERKAFETERAAFEAQRPEVERQNELDIRRQVSEDVDTAKKQRDQARKEGRAYAEEVFSRDVQGITPQQRNAMQYEANKQIQRSQQSANRKLLGEQSRHGIVGRGGVGYAQQRDLQRMANEERGQVHRDLDKLNADLALKKLAAMFNVEQGEASQAQLDRQMALDEAQLNQERRRQRSLEDKFNRLFSRV